MKLVLAVCLLAGFWCVAKPAVVQDQASRPSQPGESAEVKALIDRAEDVLRSNRSDISAVLSDPAYLTAHAWPRFREIIKRHARSSKVTMVTKEERGDRIRVRLRLVDADGSASAGALVYLYHTDARGDYGRNDAKIPIAGSDNNYARLFCYAVTDPDGALDIQTIRPRGIS